MKFNRTLALLTLGFILTGCNNSPFPTEGKKADGSPKVVWYQALEEDPRSLDPQVSYDDTSSQILLNIDEPLYQYSYLARKRIKLIPAVAESMPIKTPNAEGGETYTIKIKKGLLYQDDPCFPGGKGREVTSDDVIFAMKRLGDPFIKAPTSSPIYDTLSPIIIGLQEFYEANQKAGKTDYTRPLTGVEKVDRYTFKIKTKSIYPQLKYWMAFNFFSPVPAEAVAYYDGQVHDGKRRDRFQDHPVGTGAYKLKEWRRNEYITLERNYNHVTSFYPTVGDPGDKEKGLLNDAGKPLPFLDEARFNIMREAIPIWTLFRQGYLDTMGKTSSRRQTQNIAEKAIDANQKLTGNFQKAGVQMERVSLLSTDNIVMNMNDPLFSNNKKLRQALSIAYNYSDFNDFFFSGVKLKAESTISPGMFGYDPDYKNPWRLENLEKGKQLMKEAGYPDGIDPKTGKPLVLEVTYPERGPESKREVQYITDQFRKLGINAKARLVTFAESLTILDRGNFQVSRSGWFADYPDPENFLFLYYSKSGPLINNPRYYNPEYDRLFEKMKVLEDTPERYAIIRKMVEILNEDCPVIYTFHESFYMPYAAWVKNAQLHPIAFNTLKYFKTDPVLRAEKQQEWNQPNYTFLVALAGVLVAVALPLVLRREKW